MKITSFLFIAANSLILSCTAPDTRTNEVSLINNVPDTTCYAFTTAKDTVTLKLITADAKIYGSLEYRLQEKDANKGTINGQIKGDTLIADYTFFSEGMESVREVVFVKKDNMLTEGYGEMDEINGRLVFKNKTQLDFSGILILKKVDCKK